MSDLRKIWSNQHLAISAEVDQNTIKKHSSKILATIKTKPDNISLEFYEDGYSVIENGDSLNEFTVNEYNLCNLILMELFEQIVYKQEDFSNIHMPENMADYLIKTSKLENEYTWFGGRLYNNIANRNMYLNRLTSYNEKIQSKDAIRANECLKIVIEQSDEKTISNLVGSDLRFAGLTEGAKYNEKDIVLEDAVAIYSCKRSKVSGIIKHVSNKLNKIKTESNSYKLQQLFDMLKEHVQNGYSVSIVPDEYIEIYTCIPYRINFLENGRVRVSWKDADGKIGTVKNVKPVPVSIMTIIDANERA